MENQHRKISGYRELTQAEIDLMNTIKEMGPKLAALTGTPVRARQAAWLAREGWPFVLGWDGRPRVAREYHDRVLLGRGSRVEPRAVLPNLSEA